MRRWLVLLLCALLLAGCSDLATLFISENGDEEPLAYVSPTPGRVFPEELTTATRIRARGEMVVGVRYDLPPFSYISEGGDLSGLEIDLARELARRWLDNPDAVRFQQVRSDTAIEHLTNGTVDIVLAGVPHTQGGEARADFSPPYFVNGQALLAYTESGVQGLDDLQGHAVAVVSWTDSRAALDATSPVSVTYVSQEDFFTAIEALRTRQVHVYADMRHRLVRAQELLNGTTVVGQYTWEPVALVYRHDDPFFANLVALTFQDMVLDGTRDALYARWLPDTSPPQIVLWPGDAPAPEFSASPETRSTLDVISRIRERGHLNAGYFIDRWPYSGDRADGVPTGFEVRLLERIVERWLGSREVVTFVPVTEADGVQKLEAGEVDMLVGGWVHTRERELRADFSIPVLDDGVSLFSLASDPVPVLEDLGGRPLGVVSGSAGDAAVGALSQSLGAGIATKSYPDFPSALAGLQQGEVAAILSERRPLLEVFYNQVGFFLSDVRYTYRPVAWVLPQGDSAFRDLVNLTIASLYEQGSYSDLYTLWFDDPDPRLDVWPGNPTIVLRIDLPSAPAEE